MIVPRFAPPQTGCIKCIRIGWCLGRSNIPTIPLAVNIYFARENSHDESRYGKRKCDGKMNDENTLLALLYASASLLDTDCLDELDIELV